MSNIGYARVSTKKQGSSLDSQIQSLKKHYISLLLFISLMENINFRYAHHMVK
jgi:DNA invertase Pin-like site-specific DNA recombinase